MDPIIGSALIGAGSQLFGGIFGGYGQKKASENYLKAQRETNEQNYKIWQEQKDHNLEMYNLQKQDTWDMWNAENEYNSAAAQRERLEAAGYNPYLAISGMSGNSAGSMSTPQMQSTQTPTMQAPGIEGFNNSLSAIGASFQGIGDAVRSLYELQNLQTDTYKKYQEAKKTGSDKALTDYNLKFLHDTEQMRKHSMDLLNQEIRAKIDNFQAQTHLTNLQAKYQDILNTYLPQQQQLDLFIKAQNWVNLELQGKLTEQQVKTSIAQEFMYYAQGNAATQQAELFRLQAYDQGQRNLVWNVDYWKEQGVDVPEFVEAIYKQTVSSANIEEMRETHHRNRGFGSSTETTSSSSSYEGGAFSIHGSYSGSESQSITRDYGY